MTEASWTDTPSRPFWSSLWFTFWIFLVGGAILIQFIDSAVFYYWVQHASGSQKSAVLFLAFSIAISVVHAATATYFVWIASRDSRISIKTITRTVSILYLVLVLVGVIFGTCAFFELGHP